MSGRFAVGFILIAALLAAGGVWWTQVYAYYTEIAARDEAAQIRLVTIAGGTPEPILAEDFSGIDAESSPLRFRACFRTPQSLAMMTETYMPAPEAEPLNGPGWFSCYDARRIGEALERGDAVAFLSEHNIHPGVDRIVAVFPDGSAFAWHQLNEEAEPKTGL